MAGLNFGGQVTPTLFGTALHQLGQKNPHRVVIGNRKPVRMLSHDCTSILQIVFVLASPISSNSNPPQKFTATTTSYTTCPRYFRAVCDSFRKPSKYRKSVSRDVPVKEGAHRFVPTDMW
jgi:hypothetical protein